MNRICHLTSAHPRHDIRIFFKQCKTITMEGYPVSLIVADGLGHEFKDGVEIIDVGRSASRLNRILQTTRKILAKALELHCDIYQLHDPELLPIGMKLKQKGKKVLYDAHEDTPVQILTKPYLNKPIRFVLSRVLSAYERHACSHFDGILAATPHIRDKFLKINSKSVDINNFPLPDEFACPENALLLREDKDFCYLGSISSIRGIREMVLAMGLIQSPARLQLGGVFVDKLLEDEVKLLPGWERVLHRGWLDRPQVRKVLETSIAGLVTLHPIPNYKNSLPIKMFEYMSAGIPVIASDFPLWRQIVEEHQCGICVDPLNQEKIAHTMDFLSHHPGRCFEMGQRGRKAVLDHFNWQTEKKKLLTLYNDLTHEQGHLDH